MTQENILEFRRSGHRSTVGNEESWYHICNLLSHSSVLMLLLLTVMLTVILTKVGMMTEVRMMMVKMRRAGGGKTERQMLTTGEEHTGIHRIIQAPENLPLV